MLERADFFSVFTDLAARQPFAEAILAPDRSSLRFGDLPKKLGTVQRALNGFGCGRGDLVAIALPKGPEMAVCVAAVASCAIAVPLNPDYTDDEFARYLARIRPKAIILPADSANAARRQSGALGIPIVDLAFDPAQEIGSFELRCKRRGKPSRGGWNDADDVALLLLTSGSTGQSKLVPQRQRHIAAYAQAAEKMYGLGPGDRSIHVMPMFHGNGTKSSLLLPLLLGAGVVCPDRFDVPSFFANLERFRPSWYSGGYTIQHAILDQIGPYRAVARAARLRFIRSGSGRLDPKIMRGLEEAFDAPVVERYGMSETGTLTYNPLPPATRRPGTVGIPLANGVKIIDENGGFLGPGRDGEVVARGPTVFDGYWNDPVANAASFIDGWFRTGDLGRFSADGYLTITGRIKDLINRGGEKFSPVEVEKILCEHPLVGAACVFAIPHPTLGEEAAAAIVPIEGATIAEQDILAHARARLIWFKVPRRIFVCTGLPKSDSGKVHRASVARMCLPMMTQTGANKPASCTRAPSDLEREILLLWNAVLKTDTTDLDQDFFLAGGDSLKAVDLFVRIQTRLGVAVELRRIYDEATTVAGIARIVGRAPAGTMSRRALPAGLVAIKTSGGQPPLFGVPGSDGNPVIYLQLGRLLDQAQPLYGIEAVGLDGIEAPIDCLEAIAAEHIRRIKVLQPDGPYFLTGACFGGRVAYEMARQLTHAGDRVGLLILLDPSPPLTNSHGDPRGKTTSKAKASRPALLTRFLRDRVALHAKSLIRLRGAQRRAYLREKLDILRQMIRQRDPFRGDRSELLRRAVYEANRRAGRAYVPGRYEGPVILCFTRDRLVRGERNFREDWLTLVPQCGSPVLVSGKDSSAMLFLPHVHELSEHINLWLKNATDQDATAVASSEASLVAAL